MDQKISRPYFAHQVNAYYTKLELGVLLLISDTFGISPQDIVNPNLVEHQEGYERYSASRKNMADTTHKGMDYFYDEVLPRCDSGIMWGFLDGRIGLGVAGEMQKLLKAGKPCFGVYLSQKPTEVALWEFEHDYTSGLFGIGAIGEKELEWLQNFDMKQINESDLGRTKAPWETLIVPHVETRLRTFYIYGQKKRPYKEAHLARMPLPENFYPDNK